MKCPKCQFDNREGVRFCERCGAKMSKQINSLNNEFYDKYGVEWSSTERRGEEKIATLYKVANLCDLLEGLSPKRILDFGCGLGDALDALSRHFQTTDAIGVDISPKMIKYAKKNYSQLKFIEGGIEKIKDVQGVDLITFLDVLEHLPDVPAVLQVVKNIVNYIAIKIPLEKTWLISLLNGLGIKKPVSRLYESEGHLYEFNRSEVEDMIKQVGLTVVKAKTAFPPKYLMFTPYMISRMRKKTGFLARPKYYCYIAFSKLPYSLTRPLFNIANGVDFFVLCKSYERNTE